MKNKLITGIIVLALAFVGTTLGSAVGRLVPSAGTLLDSQPASAEGLTTQPAGPLTPSPLGSGFTYQGKLLNSGSPVSGSYDFTFRLYDEVAAGTSVSGPISVTTVISNGLFTVNLDFGSSSTIFNGDVRYLEIATRQTGGGSYTTLSPRQAITPAPYALFALKTKGYKNVVTVSPDGGDFTSVTAALNAITTNSPTNKYLVWVGPGTYTETVTMKQWVDIEGAGEKTTKITFTGNPGFVSGTLFGASNAELRSLSVENTGDNTFATAIFNSAASPSLLHVTAIASGGTNNTGVLNSNSSSPTMSNITATASGGSSNSGVYNDTSSPTMSNVTAIAFGGTNNYGVYNLSSPSSMNNVIATASGGTSFNYGVRNESVATSMNNVTAIASGGSVSTGVYNYNNSSTLTDVRATASGGANANYGVRNDAASPSMTDVTAIASGGANNYGVANFTNASPTMIDVTATASGGTVSNTGVRNLNNSSPNMSNVTVTASGVSPNNYGVNNDASSPNIRASSVSATGGTNNYGVNSTTSGTVTIDSSKITASSSTVVSGQAELITRVGASQLSGGPVINNGTLTCSATYDENYISPGLNVCP